MHQFVLPILIDLLSETGFDEDQLMTGSSFESIDAAMNA